MSYTTGQEDASKGAVPMMPPPEKVTSKLKPLRKDAKRWREQRRRKTAALR